MCFHSHFSKHLGLLSSFTFSKSSSNFLSKMFSRSRLLVAITTVLSFSSALPTIIEGTGSSPLPPSQDPFYTTPASYESAKPGDILRIRTAPGNFTSIVSNSSKAYNILYRTTDTHQNPSWAVTTLLAPITSKDAASYQTTGSNQALLSWQVAYDTADVDSSPSYAFYTDLDTRDISAALGRGWWVNVPDYEGPLASFVAGGQAGHATLDSIRAVLSAKFGLSPRSQYAMWGYSGGALASGWAAELQPEYAPELKFAGVAMGGTPANAEVSLGAVNGGFFAGLIPAAFLGLSTQHAAFHALVSEKTKIEGPFNRTFFLAARNYSINECLAAFAFQNLTDYFIHGQADLETPDLKKVFTEDTVLGFHGIPKAPLFVYQAVEDDVAPAKPVDNMVDSYCNGGANILYQRNSVGNHVDEADNGKPRAVAWLSSVFDGTHESKYGFKGCTIQNVTITV